MGIFARRDIQQGDELTYDYFFEHYGASAVAAGSFKCMCGAVNCRWVGGREGAGAASAVAAGSIRCMCCWWVVSREEAGAASAVAAGSIRCMCYWWVGGRVGGRYV